MQGLGDKYDGSGNAGALMQNGYRNLDVVAGSRGVVLPNFGELNPADDEETDIAPITHEDPIGKVLIYLDTDCAAASPIADAVGAALRRQEEITRDGVSIDIKFSSEINPQLREGCRQLVERIIQVQRQG